MLQKPSNKHTFNQEPQIWRIIRVGGRFYVTPVVTVGMYTAVITDDSQPDVEVLSEISKVAIGEFDKFPGCERKFNEVANESYLSLLLAYTSNVIVAAHRQGEPSNFRKLQQDFVDFFSDLLNAEYESGTHLAKVYLNVQRFVAEAIAETGQPEILYYIANFMHDGLELFIDTHLNKSEMKDDSDIQALKEMFG